MVQTVVGIFIFTRQLIGHIRSGIPLIKPVNNQLIN